MEKVSYLLNGQWTLEKWSGKHIDRAVDWVERGMHESLDDLPKAKGLMRRSMLKDLELDIDKLNKVPGLQRRVNPETGEKEYLLHRTQSIMPSGKAQRQQPRSWSADEGFCHYWGSYNKTTRIISAWIPEKHIHSYLPTAARIEQGPVNDWAKNEHEVLVAPHKLNIVNIQKPNINEQG